MSSKRAKAGHGVGNIGKMGPCLIEKQVEPLSFVSSQHRPLKLPVICLWVTSYLVTRPLSGSAMLGDVILPTGMRWAT